MLITINLGYLALFRYSQLGCASLTMAHKTTRAPVHLYPCGGRHKCLYVNYRFSLIIRVVGRRPELCSYPPEQQFCRHVQGIYKQTIIIYGIYTRCQ